MKSSVFGLVSSASLLLASLLPGCSSDGPAAAGETRETIGQTRAPVIKGTDSDASQDAVVLLIHYDPKQSAIAACTGTLLSDRLVLTARHCVADTDESAACDVNGNPLGGGAVRGDHPASTLYVFTGAQRPNFASGAQVVPDGVGAQVLDDGSTTLCNHDVAMVVLKDPIKNAKISPIRLDGDVTKGEVVTSIGWGVTDTTTSPDTRQQRSGVSVLLVGPADDPQEAVPPNEFEVGESICSGDSGGPAVASSGALIGIVSRGGNNTQPDPNNPATGCTNATNIYTKSAPFKAFIMKGFAAVGADPWLENGPDPRLAVTGTACTAAAECRSNVCVADPTAANAMTCAVDCSVTACADGLTCMTSGTSRVCRDAAAVAAATTTTTTTKSCAMSPGSTSSGGGGLLAGGLLGVAALVVARRRRA